VSTRILLVEDNAVYRSSLELLLGLQQGLEVVGAVGSGDEAADAASRLGADVVLMDYRLPGMDGVEATAALLAAYPEAAVIGLTASANLRERQALSDAGAVDCLSKDGELDQIVAAIHRAVGTTPAE